MMGTATDIGSQPTNQDLVIRVIPMRLTYRCEKSRNGFNLVIEIFVANF